MDAFQEQANGGYGQTNTDRMLKFLEDVKLNNILTLTYFKKTIGTKLARNIEKRPHVQF